MTTTFDLSIRLNYEEIIKNIKECKKGNEYAFNLLASHYYPLIKKYATSFYLKGGDINDMIQEGLIGLYQAVQVFDETKGTSFNLIAKKCVRRRILQIIRANNAYKQLIHYESKFLYDEIDEGIRIIDLLPLSGESPLNQILKKEKLTEIYDSVKNCLTPFERKIFYLALEGYSYKEISEKTGTSLKSIDNAISRSKKKLKKIHMYK